MTARMIIELHHIPVREVVNGYHEAKESGVTGYGGRLNIRPSFQREFIYTTDQQRAVIDTIFKGFPLNVMYWVKGENGMYEMLDGQQRTLSICLYSVNGLSLDSKSYLNLTQDQRDIFLDYQLMIYICEGNEQEKLDWFETINIAGEKLTRQERRNAIYAGSWLEDAKRYFSRQGCPAYKAHGSYMSGISIRQEYLETVIRWIASRDGIHAKDIVSEYMSIHQHDKDCVAMKNYFEEVMRWVRETFIHYRDIMKKVDWGILCNKYSRYKLEASEL